MSWLSPKIFIGILSVLLVLSFLIGVGMGAVPISPLQTFGIICKKAGIHTNIAFTEQQEMVLISIRLPRVLFGLLIGAGLAVSGAAMQGLFRNPLADPGLIGVSSGATMAAVLVIMLGMGWIGGLANVLGAYTLPLFSFIGAFAVTLLVYRISNHKGKTVVSTLLLAGIALNALAGAITGFMIFYANDAQLRTITFWSLGSLGGATWTSVIGILPFIVIPMLVLPRMAKPLDAFSLGESNAQYLGIRTENVKRLIIVLTALAVGASVAVAGVIGFVGLVVPHIVRMIIGPGHRYLFAASALTGAVLLMLSDLISRTVAAPSEIPIGVITALFGSPFFLYMIVKERNQFKLM